MIKRIENKYLVLKTDDIDKYLSDEMSKIGFNESLNIIYRKRMLDGKDSWNHYVVLNLADKIDIDYLVKALLELNNGLHDNKFEVKNIAVMLINSISNVNMEE